MSNFGTPATSHRRDRKASDAPHKLEISHTTPKQQRRRHNSTQNHFVGHDPLSPALLERLRAPEWNERFEAVSQLEDIVDDNPKGMAPYAVKVSIFLCVSDCMRAIRHGCKHCVHVTEPKIIGDHSHWPFSILLFYYDDLPTCIFALHTIAC